MRRFFVLTLAFVCWLLAATAPARSMNLYSYDLDSLVYLSSDIVDAGVLSQRYENNLDITTVRVTRVYLGHFHAGEAVQVTAMDFYRVNGRRIGAGDHLTLFLAKAKPAFLYNIPKDANLYWPAPSGVKILDEGRTKSFQQYDNPGPYEREWTTPDSLKRLPTPEQFQAQLITSVSHVETLRPLLSKAVTPADDADLLDLLRLRKQPGPGMGRMGRDAISEVACDQNVSLHSLDAIGDALAIVKYEDLTNALQNPQGRNFLIQVVDSPAQPLARRLGCAEATEPAYSWWDAKASDNYVSRLAALCWSVRSTPVLSETLLDQLDELARVDASGDGTQPQPANAQIVSSLPLLRRLYKTTDDPALRFDVEKLVWKAAGYVAYRTLNSPCGPVLSLAQPPDRPLADLPPSIGKLTYQSSIRWADPTWRDARDMTPALVLVNAKTGARIALPLGREVYGSDSMEDRDMTSQTNLPPGLPHGRYHIFLEFIRPNQPVSTGYGYDADL